ncbi:hypothetical protein BDZ97DRAFT_1237311 [Flammula alnicola]|nr:hypothetical protein BDZ97DRAFT_1237311 [Flammula alnicola]
MCIACRLKGLKPKDCVVTAGTNRQCQRCKDAKRPCSLRLKLKDQVPMVEAAHLVARGSLTNIDHLFGRLHRASAVQLIRQDLVHNYELEIIALTREILFALHAVMASDPDENFFSLYLNNNTATLHALINALSTMSPGALSTNDNDPDTSASLLRLAPLLEGIPVPDWYPQAGPSLPPFPRSVAYQEVDSEVEEAPATDDSGIEFVDREAIEVNKEGVDISDAEDFDSA